jgi:hypothetical protein
VSRFNAEKRRFVALSNCLLSALPSGAEADYISLTYPIRPSARISADRRLREPFLTLIPRYRHNSTLLDSLIRYFTLHFTQYTDNIYIVDLSTSLYPNIDGATTLSTSHRLQVSVSRRTIAFKACQAEANDPVRRCEGSVPTQRALRKGMTGQA